MFVATGTSVGTFNGTFNITSTAIRFSITFQIHSYIGTFVISGSQMTYFETVPTREEVDALNGKMPLGGVASRLIVASNNNAGDTCFFTFDRSDGIQYKVSFGTNNTIYFQKYENGEWTTIWTK